MKKWLMVVLALFLCVGILVYVAADVNHGYGPGVHVEESHGEEGHGEESHGEESAEEHAEEQEGEGH